ncbi:hydantoinase/oxoprolinase family protein [Sporosarcina sp. FSL K6-1522]|uniref:hydantoinase/oxoprolinase family protein n=1 Tax=Sporosarcina sp. FSL K6-1522 TaxID=2921554 RepID=UPI00315A29FC
MEIYRIGIDVGGTHTDAVILDESYNVIAEAKEATSADTSTGIFNALKRVIATSGVDKSQIKYAMLGTTHCTNAIVERKRLNKVASIRIGAPATLAIKPLIGVPDDLKKIIGQHVHIVEGGHEFDGREITQLNEEEIRQICRSLIGKVDSMAVVSVFSPISKVHEERVSEIIREEMGSDIAISQSAEIGNVGLIERENATILNAAIVNVAKITAQSFIEALKNEGVEATVFFGQNDGTLMSVEYTMKYPILTIACGPTNSIRGASYLSSKKDALVVDVGGTTTDIGVLSSGFPRQSSLAVDVGGVRTNFRMPDILSLGLGGGTIITLHDDGAFSIGPESVGHNLYKEGLAFGGNTLTTTDVVIALGKASIGNRELVAHLDRALLEKIYARMTFMLEESIDKMKISADDVAVVLVGGGSILFPTHLKGANEVVKPENYGVANAIGSAISQVSAQVEKIFKMDDLGRERTLERAKSMAYEEAVKAGANRDNLTVVDIQEVPLAYLAGNATKVRIKVAGDLA